MKPQRSTVETQIDYVQLGLLLQGAREEKNMTREEVATTLRFQKHWVEALELGKVDIFPTIVYARGHLANYARLLGAESVMQNPPVKEVLINPIATEKKNDSEGQQVAPKMVKVVQTIEQTTPVQVSPKLPVQFIHITAESSSSDRRSQLEAAQQSVRWVYWAMIGTLGSLLGYMFYEQWQKPITATQEAIESPKTINTKEKL